MVAARKFLFDSLDFDAEEPSGPVIPATPEPPEPTFSRGELDAARAQGFAEGQAAGLVDAKQSRDQVVAATLARIAVHTELLVSGEAARTAQSQAESVRLAVAIVRKMLPGLARRHGLTEIEAMIGDCLADLVDEPRVVVRVHDRMLDSLKERVDAVARERGFAGKLVLLADPGLMDTDCRVEWADGGAERDIGRLWQQIERLGQQAAAADRAPAPPLNTEHANFEL